MSLFISGKIIITTLFLKPMNDKSLVDLVINSTSQEHKQTLEDF